MSDPENMPDFMDDLFDPIRTGDPFADEIERLLNQTGGPVSIDEDAKQVVVSRDSNESASRAYHGLTRSLIANMIQGVKEGYEKRLEIVGVGYVGSVQGQELSLRVGYANELKKKIPAGLDVTCPDQTHVVVKGCSKQMVGHFAAEVRALRKPEPYKGKGIRYQGEHIKLKPGKAAT